MLSKNEIELLERHVNGLANEKESFLLEELFYNGHTNNDLKDHLENDWETDFCIETPSKDLSRILDRVHSIILKTENKSRKFVPGFVSVYNKVAAILLLPLLIAGALTFSYSGAFNGKTENQVTSVIHAPIGSRVSFNLPDGSAGWLNSGSQLTYSLPFNKNRIVSLKGEAWFDVTPDKKHPFEISVGESKIKVLGTSFNVSAYPEMQGIEIVLQKGRVEFYAANNSPAVTISPSQKLSYHDGKTDLSRTDPSKYKAWTDGKLVFRGDNMAEVAGRIERWYNVKVILKDQDLKNFTFRATFEDDSLEDVLRLLSMTSPIGYKIASDYVKSDGTFEKITVTLYKRVLNKKY